MKKKKKEEEEEACCRTALANITGVVCSGAGSFVRLYFSSVLLLAKC